MLLLHFKICFLLRSFSIKPNQLIYNRSYKVQTNSNFLIESKFLFSLNISSCFDCRTLVFSVKLLFALANQLNTFKSTSQSPYKTLKKNYPC